MKTWLIALALAITTAPAWAADKPVAQRLHEAIEEVCPIDGVSIADKDDKKTWRIDFKATASSVQKEAAKQVLRNFDVSAPDLEDVARKAAAAKLQDAVKGEDNAAVVDALKEALETGALKISD